MRPGPDAEPPDPERRPPPVPAPPHPSRPRWPCLQCGYELEGLPRAFPLLCPECGRPHAESERGQGPPPTRTQLLRGGLFLSVGMPQLALVALMLILRAGGDALAQLLLLLWLLFALLLPIGGMSLINDAPHYVSSRKSTAVFILLAGWLLNALLAPLVAAVLAGLLW